MVVDTAFLITAFVTMFVVIDPIGMAPLFVALTQEMSDKARRRIALRATAIAMIILLAFAIFGEALLGFVGISMPAFRIAGGVLLFLTALDMLFERRTKRRADQSDQAAEDDDMDDPSVFPLAIPLIAGPGSIASVILLMGQRPGVEGAVLVLGATAMVMLIVLAFFLLSGPIGRALGKTGITVVTRLLGMLLAALSVQFVLDGLAAYGFGPGVG
ncbi:MAG: MarC family protein [Roseobacter sp.]